MRRSLCLSHLLRASVCLLALACSTTQKRDGLPRIDELLTRVEKVQIDMDLAQAYDYAADVMVKNMMARDAAEGISAFIDKRAARWEDC